MLPNKPLSTSKLPPVGGFAIKGVLWSPIALALVSNTCWAGVLQTKAIHKNKRATIFILTYSDFKVYVFAVFAFLYIAGIKKH